jgi:phosphonate transport system permease protein
VNATSSLLREGLSAARRAELQGAYAAAIGARRRAMALLFAVLALLVITTGWVGEVNLATLAKNAWRLPDYVLRTLPELHWATLGKDLAEWYWGLSRWLRLLGETLLIAYVGTLVGAFGAFVLCFLASANLTPSRAVVFATRRWMELCRTVPELVFALVFVIAFGLGPLPGVLAIVIHCTGALGKLFAEVVENIDLRPVEGVRATGATRLEAISHAVLPQVWPHFASYTLLRFEVNVRSAAIMGFVGAGGIGQELLEAVRKFYYTDVSAILLLIMVTVMLIDIATERLRHRLFDVRALT